MNDIWVLREADIHEFPPSTLTSISTDVPAGSYVIKPLSVIALIEDPRFVVDPIAILFDCEDQSIKQSNTTQTNINLDIDFNAPVKEMSNINPIKSQASGVQAGNAKGKGFLAVIVVLVLIVAVLLFFVYKKLMA